MFVPQGVPNCEIYPNLNKALCKQNVLQYVINVAINSEYL